MTELATLLSKKDAGEETLVSLMVAALPHVEGVTGAEMRSQLTAELGADRVEEFCAQFEADPEARVEAASLWLAAAGSDPAQEAKILSVVDEAGEQLAVIELGMVALVALYAIHAIAKPEAKRVRRIKRDADGSYQEVEEVDFQSFTEPVKGLLGILGRGSAS